MSRAIRSLAVFSFLALLQACASRPLPPAASAHTGTPGVVLERGADAPPARPAPQPGTAAIDATRLPPFEGEKREISDPLRGLRKVDRTVQPDDLWERIRHGFAMPDLDNALVREKTAYYAARPEYQIGRAHV